MLRQIRTNSCRKNYWQASGCNPFSCQTDQTYFRKKIFQHCGLFSTNMYGPKLFSSEKLSYIEKAKYFQYLKEDPKKCSELLQYGSFIVYCGSRPFLKVAGDATDEKKSQLIWLTYTDLQDYKDQIESSAVLLDVDENKCLYFGIQIGKLDPASLKKFEKDKHGKFFDLRIALFTVDSKSSKILSQSNALLMFHKKNNFCGNCGVTLKRTCSGYSLSCSNCSNVLYPVSNPVGIVLVTDSNNQNAILVRQPRHPKGMYTCIAGFSDVGETLEQTVQREVAEEVGVEVSDIQYVASQHWPFPGSLMAGCYAVTSNTEMSIDSNELEDARWFSREEIGEAIMRVEKNPSLMFLSNDDTKLFIPLPGAIAFSLIKHWYDRTPAHEISSKL